MKRFTAIVLLAILVSACAGIAAATATKTFFGQTQTSDPHPGWWHTSGVRIVDSSGVTVRIAGVTWYGMESSYWVPAGLDYQPYTSIMDRVKSLGYNTIRLPYSNEMVETNPTVTERVKANPDFQGRHAMYVLDSIMSYAKQIGLKIILDDHRCRASRPRYVNYLDEPLWYTKDYPESAWLRDWQTLASRYSRNDALIGADLRNEPHTDGPGPWTVNAYLNQGATWGPYNGSENHATDWRLAAERGGNAVLAANPRLLIFVEGVQLYPNQAWVNGVQSYWWGSILTGAKKYPVTLDIPHQLVYSPHDWGPWKYRMRWFGSMSYVSMQAIWHDMWSFLVDDRGPHAAPLWIGEFGTCTDNPRCVDRPATDNQATWFNLVIRFLREHPYVGWSFFALNGTNSNDHLANNGLLNGTWDDVANPALRDRLAAIQR